MTPQMTDETEDERMRRLVTDQYVRPLPKRFYKNVAVTAANQIELDGRAVKTPLKAPLILPTRALAEAVAEEWRAQVKVINPGVMPLTKLANTALDRAVSERHNMIEELVRYANDDLVCYRAEAPVSLVQRQQSVWDPVIVWAEQDLRVLFKTAQGIIHADQPPETLDAVRRRLERLDHFALTAIYNVATMLGTILITLKLNDISMTPDAAWAAAHLDEDFQIEEWGHDEEQAKRRAGRRAEFDATISFLQLISTAA